MSIKRISPKTSPGVIHEVGEPSGDPGPGGGRKGAGRLGLDQGGDLGAARAAESATPAAGCRGRRDRSARARRRTVERRGRRFVPGQREASSVSLFRGRDAYRRALLPGCRSFQMADPSPVRCALAHRADRRVLRPSRFRWPRPVRCVDRDLAGTLRPGQDTGPTTCGLPPLSRTGLRTVDERRRHPLPPAGRRTRRGSARRALAGAPGGRRPGGARRHPLCAVRLQPRRGAARSRLRLFRVRGPDPACVRARHGGDPARRGDGDGRCGPAARRPHPARTERRDRAHHPAHRPARPGAGAARHRRLRHQRLQGEDRTHRRQAVHQPDRGPAGLPAAQAPGGDAARARDHHRRGPDAARLQVDAAPGRGRSDPGRLAAQRDLRRHPGAAARAGRAAGRAQRARRFGLLPAPRRDGCGVPSTTTCG